MGCLSQLTPVFSHLNRGSLCGLGIRKACTVLAALKEVMAPSRRIRLANVSGALTFSEASINCLLLFVDLDFHFFADDLTAKILVQALGRKEP
jgi:hypothetical protein